MRGARRSRPCIPAVHPVAGRRGCRVRRSIYRTRPLSHRESLGPQLAEPLSPGAVNSRVDRGEARLRHRRDDRAAWFEDERTSRTSRRGAPRAPTPQAEGPRQPMRLEVPGSQRPRGSRCRPTAGCRSPTPSSIGTAPYGEARRPDVHDQGASPARGVPVPGRSGRSSGRTEHAVRWTSEQHGRTVTDCRNGAARRAATPANIRPSIPSLGFSPCDRRA